MGKKQKVLTKILSGFADKNIGFQELKNLLLHLGFEIRIKGSHHIFTHDKVEEILNLQPKFGRAKPYQVKQIRNIIIKHKFKI